MPPDFLTHVTIHSSSLLRSIPFSLHFSITQFSLFSSSQPGFTPAYPLALPSLILYHTGYHIYSVIFLCFHFKENLNPPHYFNIQLTIGSQGIRSSSPFSYPQISFSDWENISFETIHFSYYLIHVTCLSTFYYPYDNCSPISALLSTRNFLYSYLSTVASSHNFYPEEVW